VVEKYAPPHDGLVVDIGSNDGTLLNFFKAAGMQVLGIDPAKEIAEDATEAGLPTLAEFFTPALAAKIRAEHGAAMLVTANNVFAHADELGAIADGVRTLTADDGIFVFEVSYLVDVYEGTLFDTIYHEHLAYHTVKPLERFFRGHGMELIAAERVGSHGGSLRGFVQHAGGGRPVEDSVAELIEMESALGLDRAETLKKFAEKIDKVRAELTGLLTSYKMAGKTIAGFGAPAKATTLMHHFAIGPEVIDFIVDDSPLKQGLFSPGMHIPVVASDELYARRPDVAVVLAWNFAEPIIRNHRKFLDGGGHFVVPLPEVRVV
jgi:SAM-dependent methyltransferase